MQIKGKGQVPFEDISPGLGFNWGGVSRIRLSEG